MTKPRIYGEDSPFGRWMRNHPALDSIEVCLSASDRDFACHHYKTHIDGLGTRDVRLMFNLEIKTRGALPNPSQLEGLFFEHQLLHKTRWVRHPAGHRVRLWHFGHFVLSLVGEAPGGEDSYVTWCQFTKAGGLDGRTIPVASLIDILQFRRRPDTLAVLDLRRHHKTQRLIEVVQMPIGIPMARLVVKRS